MITSVRNQGSMVEQMLQTATQFTSCHLTGHNAWEDVGRTLETFFLIFCKERCSKRSVIRPLKLLGLSERAIHTSNGFKMADI